MLALFLFILVHYLLCFLCLYHLPEAGCYDGTNERTYDEDPNVGQCLATSEECGAYRTCGVYRLRFTVYGLSHTEFNY